MQSALTSVLQLTTALLLSVPLALQASPVTLTVPVAGHETLTPELFPPAQGSAKRPAPATATAGVARIEELDKAFESFQRQDYEHALQLLQTATSRHRTLPPAHLMLARLFLVHNQLARGQAALEQAIIEQPGYPGIYNSFGSLALAEGRLTDALLHFEKAALLGRSGGWTERQKTFFLTQSQAGLAAIAEQRRDWAAAQAALTAWLELEPRQGTVRQRLARALFELDKLTAAQEHLAQAVKDDATLEPAALSLAWLYTQKGKFDKAAEILRAALKQAPKEARLQRGMAALLLQQGKPQEARPYVDAAAKLDPDAPELKRLRGLSARALKDYSQAESHFQALHQEMPGDFQASNQWALALIEQEDKSKQQRAVQLAEMNARAYANTPEAMATLGWVYYRLGRLEEAERALQSAVSGGIGSAETAYYLAHVMAARGRLQETQRLLTAAVDAPGQFMFRQEAQAWLARISKKP